MTLRIRDPRTWRYIRVPLNAERMSPTAVLIMAYAALLLGFVIVLFVVWKEG